jgi:hypothetical protein
VVLLAVARCSLYLIYNFSVLLVYFGPGGMCIPIINALLRPLVGRQPLGAVMGLMAACAEAVGS